VYWGSITLSISHTVPLVVCTLRGRLVDLRALAAALVEDGLTQEGGNLAGAVGPSRIATLALAWRHVERQNGGEVVGVGEQEVEERLGEQLEGRIDRGVDREGALAGELVDEPCLLHREGEGLEVGALQGRLDDGPVELDFRGEGARDEGAVAEALEAPVVVVRLSDRRGA
jgi:hypothetical protein